MFGGCLTFALCAGAENDAKDDLFQGKVVVNEEAIKEGLRRPFLRRDGELTDLESRIFNLASSYEGSNHLTVFQSSGTGKTKWAFSLRERNLAHLVYLHVGHLSQTSNGWPNPHPLRVMKWAFTREGRWQEAVNRMKVMLALTISRCCDTFESNSPAIVGEEVFSLNGTTNYGRMLTDISQEDWKNCDVAQCLNRIQHFQQHCDKKIIVVWDEAAGLGEAQFRIAVDGDPPGISFGTYTISARPIVVRAIQDLAQAYVDLNGGENSLPFFHVFVATTSGARSADSVLSSTDDSLRFLRTLRGELLMPVTGFTENFDIGMFNVTHPSSETTMVPRQDMSYVTRYGRPLWTTIEPPGLRQWTDTVGQFAVAKLRGGKRGGDGTSWKDLDNEEFLAVVLSRVAGFFVPTGDLEKLVRSHMAYARRVTKDGVVYAEFCSEPALAGGARLFADELGGYGSSQMIRRLLEIVSNAPVNSGDIGELAAVIILLKAMDLASCHQSEKIFPSCSVTKFLDTLLGSGWREKVAQDLPRNGTITPEEFLLQLGNRSVSFNHFFRLGSSNAVDWKQILRAAYQRCGAIICERGFKAVDLIIPIAAPGNRYTAMLIQIKNTVKYFPSVAKQERALFFEFDQKAGLYPGMYLGVRTVKGEQRAGRVGVVRKGEVQAVAYVASSLLDIECLSHEEIDAFEELCSIRREEEPLPISSEESFDDAPTVLELLNSTQSMRPPTVELDE